MSEIVIHGIHVEFPFEPYEVQKQYMTKVIQSLQQEKNALLESPTGTGKTLSLLCSSLAWLKTQTPIITKDEDDDVPICRKKRIIYSSRTHTQLHKAMKELQSTSYKTLKACILGSRDQLCIHETVSKESSLSAKNAICRHMMRSKSCHYGNNAEGASRDFECSNSVNDIEELLKMGKKKKFCPYYLTREMQNQADIIFMPYNYVFDRHIREKLKINLHDTVIILDEGHNIDKVCQDASSVCITNTEIALALRTLTAEMEEMAQEYLNFERNYTQDDICTVKETLLKLESVFDDLVVTDNLQTNANTHDGTYIFEILEKAGITRETVPFFVEKVLAMYDCISGQHNPSVGVLNKLVDDFLVLFSIDIKTIQANFNTYLQFEPTDKNTMVNYLPAKRPKKVNFWCFNPALGVEEVLKGGAHNIILTSGTLAPINATVQELGFTDPVQIECAHIVDPKQISVCVLTKGPNNEPLNSNYSNRTNPKYWNEIALTLTNVLRIVPDGVLIFFSSYTQMKTAIDNWKTKGFFDKLTAIKPFFMEESNSKNFSLTLKAYMASIEEGKGGVLIGVCRGKISEGMDFSDAYGRAVIVFGLPYPPIFDPQIKLKKSYLDKNRVKSLSGDLWYQLEATKAVNQAIGRVIRHANDYGVVLLFDVKFTQTNVVKNLSKWIQPKIMNVNSFGEIIRVLRTFFKINQERVVLKPVAVAGPSTVVEKWKTKPVIDVDELKHQEMREAVVKRTKEKTFNLLEALSDEENEAKINIPGVKSLFSLGNIGVDITQPAKKRKIKVAPLSVKDLVLEKGETKFMEEINEVKNYLCFLRTTLEDECFARFQHHLILYNQEQNLDNLLAKLKILFPPEDKETRNFFIGCKCLVLRRHRDNYDEAIKQYYS